jgi:hypothetical protein
MTKPRKAIEHALSPPPARGPQPIPISGAEVARAKEALLKERADDAAQAAADYKAELDALRAKTARLRALRLAREAAGRPEKKSK